MTTSTRDDDVRSGRGKDAIRIVPLHVDGELLRPSTRRPRLLRSHSSPTGAGTC